MDIPISVYIFMIITLVVFIITAMIPQNLSSSFFAINQMLQNSSLITIFCFFAGLFQDQNAFFKKYMHLLLPAVIILVLWIKAMVVYGEGLMTLCSSPTDKRAKSSYPFRFDSLLWNTSKMAIAIFITYMVVNFFAFFQTPFYEFFDSNEIIISYLAVGVWIGAATWPAETSCYFNLMTSACLPSETIQFTDIGESLATSSQNAGQRPQPPTDISSSSSSSSSQSVQVSS